MARGTDRRAARTFSADAAPAAQGTGTRGCHPRERTGRRPLQRAPDARLFSTDIADFEAACRAATSSDDPPRQIEWLQQADRLYRGELLPGFYEEWILTERSRFEELHRQALGRLTTAYAALQQFDAAVEAARKAIAANILCEETHCALIRVFAQMGRPADARRQFDELESLLRRELDAEPSAATRMLMEQVRAGALFAPPTPAPPVLVPTPAAPVPLPALPTPTSLPVPLTRFFGREEEIACLRALLQPTPPTAFAPPPLVTLTGPGGAGKTRLGLETARQLCPNYEEAVWFVPLADVAHADLIADAIADALACPRSAHATPLEQVVEFLQSRPAALLILDNFEHLQEDATPIVQSLRRRLPRLACLVTSRHKLNVEGERDLALLPLQTPNQAETPEQLQTYPGVQLFLDRAQAARYSFRMTGDNAEAIALLAQKLEGLPLAIELAAAWAATLAPEQILLRLSRRFDLLVSRRKDIPKRHQSLQAVLEGSYQLLPPRLQRLYARLSVFRGGWALDAAEQIAGALEGVFGGDFGCLDGLAVLQERSFVQAEERGAEMRYRLLETLREFGAEQLEAEEQFTLSRSHAAYFLALTEEAQARQRTPDEKQWFDRLEAENDNLRAALEWVTANDGATALKMSAGLCGFWMTRGLAREGNEWLEKALSAATGEMERTDADALNRQAYAEALTSLALMKLSLGSYEEGRERARESLVMLRVLEDRKGMARALNTLGAILMEQGAYDEAQAGYEECLGLYRALGYRLGESIVLANLGNVMYGRGEYALACAYYEECLQTRRMLGDKRGIAAALDYLGRAVREQGEWARARDLHAESLAMRRELNDKQSLALTLNHLGMVQIYLNEHAEARNLLEESKTHSQEIGDTGSLAEALAHLGELARMAQDTNAAHAYWLQSLTIAANAGDKSGIAALLEALAGLANSEEQFLRAAQMLGAAQAIRQEISNPLRPSQRSRYEQTINVLRSALGADRFEQAWQEGRLLQLEAALKLARPGTGL